MATKIYGIKTAGSDNGEFVYVSYKTDEDAPMSSVIAPKGDEVMAAVDGFISGSIDADALVKTLSVPSNVVADVAKRVNTKLERVSEHLSTDGIHIYFDNAGFDKIQLDESLEDQLVSMMGHRDDSEASLRDWKSYVAFTERLYRNTDPAIRNQFVTWLRSQSWLTFTEDGCFIGYRGCQRNPVTGIPESEHVGPGIVNGEVFANAHIPNPDGGVVELDRSRVVNDPARGCEMGLHVGTYDYAVGWAGNCGEGASVVRVSVAPEDVVSVPFECGAQKVRCCRFTVLDHTPLADILGDNWYEQRCHAYTYGDCDEPDDDDVDDDVDDAVDDAWCGEGMYAIDDDYGENTYHCATFDELCEHAHDAYRVNDIWFVGASDDEDDEDNEEDDDDTPIGGAEPDAVGDKVNEALETIRKELNSR